MSTLQEYAQAGMAALEEKRFDDAIAAFTAAIGVDATRPDMNHALGMAYLHRGDVGNGVPHLERAVALSKPFTDPGVQGIKRDMHVSLATAYQLLDRVAEARDVLTEVIATWPDVAEPRLQLGTLLLATGQLDEGRQAYADAADYLQADDRDAALAVAGAIEAFFDAELSGEMFLQAHQESYKDYFDQVSAEQVQSGWLTEAARMARGPDGELTPIVADGARPYALTRVDLANPADGTVSHVYTENEPMIVALNGLEPLAQAPILFPWQAGFGFDVFVCSRSPWHWLTITVQFAVPAATETALIAQVDETIGDWYLAGWNGEFGEKESGRFHYITDPEVVGDRAVTYTVDLGRGRYDAIPALLRRLSVLHERHAIQRVVFGYVRLPD